VHTVVSANFTGAATGTIADWYPTWKIYKGETPAAMSLGEMEGRAIAVSSSYLTLVGNLTAFALNEPLWVSTFQLTQFQTVAADVRISSVASVAGLVLRVTTNQEPAAFYVLRLGGTSTTYTFAKFTSGIETILGSTIPNVCTISTTAWVRVTFTVVGSSLSATCNGFNLGSVTD